MPAKCLTSHLIDVDAQASQIRLGQLNLSHQFLVCFGDIVEGHDVPAKTEKEEGAEGHQGPEWELLSKGQYLGLSIRKLASLAAAGGREGRGTTYNGHDLGLDQLRERDELEVEGEIELEAWISCCPAGHCAGERAGVPKMPAGRWRWFAERGSLWRSSERSLIVFRSIDRSD